MKRFFDQKTVNFCMAVSNMLGLTLLLLFAGAAAQNIVTNAIGQPLGFPATISTRLGTTVTATLELAGCAAHATANNIAACSSLARSPSPPPTAHHPLMPQPTI